MVRLRHRHAGDPRHRHLPPCLSVALAALQADVMAGSARDRESAGERNREPIAATMVSGRGSSGKTERYRDFFELQLRFAEAVADRTSTPIADAVLRYTNLHRRFGLGDVAKDGPSAPWHGYAQELSGLATHEQRADWTQRFYAQAPEEGPADPDQVFGCFRFDSAATGMVRLHFYNCDSEGPLSRARIRERRRELENLFSYVRRRFPNAGHVEGKSWLYGTEA